MLHGWGHIQPEAGPGASVSFSLLLGSSVDDDTDRVCGDVTRASQGQRRSVPPCQAMPHQLRPLKHPVMLPASVPPCSSIDQAAALRVFAFTVSTCSSRVRIIARVSRSPSISSPDPATPVATSALWALGLGSAWVLAWPPARRRQTAAVRLLSSTGQVRPRAAERRG